MLEIPSRMGSTYTERNRLNFQVRGHWPEMLTLFSVIESKSTAHKQALQPPMPMPHFLPITINPVLQQVLLCLVCPSDSVMVFDSITCSGSQFQISTQLTQITLPKVPHSKRRPDKSPLHLLLHNHILLLEQRLELRTILLVQQCL